METFGGTWRDNCQQQGDRMDLGEELLEAIWCNKPDEVSKLIDDGADVNQMGLVFQDEPITPLSLACKMGHMDIVKILVQRKADLNQSGHDGKTAMHYACEGDERRDEKKENLLEILGFLIKNGANVEAMNNMRCTPLFSACEMDDVDMVKLLVQSGCKVNVQSVNGDSPMKLACRNAKFWTYWHSREMYANSTQCNPHNLPPVQITKILLHSNANISEATLLPTAVQFGDLKLVKELIELGMDINMLDDNMCTPLGSACSCVNVKADVVKLLLEHGADINRGGGWKKQKPIIFAYVHNSVNKIKLLLSYGATLTREEMTNLVSLSFSKAILENPEVITPWSKELMSWNLLLAAGFIPVDNDPVLANKLDQLRLCSSYDKISPWIWDMIFPSRSLKDLCRIAIRDNLKNLVKDIAIELLPLPTEIKKYLQFSEFYLPEKVTSSDSYGSKSPVKPPCT
ncbi:ankyrin repeat domain-containing protein 27-like [Saccostrea cucullata]|uniref:ankyrin repeat domain-containing protein 27-like n=1 Tax=Saccostrea cuccullata TaxID=36930 RepID=UPI002ED589E8